MAVEQVRPEKVGRLLQKETVPWHSGLESQAFGVSVIDNPDPVLQYLAQRNEEIYRAMERSDLAIKTARNKRDNTLLAAGSEVTPGSQSPAAMELKNWTVSFLKTIPRFTEVQREILDALYWGWRPVECTWNPEFRHKGKPYLGIDSIREKKPEQFKFTTERNLVWFDPETAAGGAHVNDGQLFRMERPENRLRWIIATAGSIDNPYGEGLYQAVWFMWYTKQRFQEMYSTGMGRSLGVVVARQSGGNIADMSKDPAAAMLEIQGELKSVLDLLNKNNILIERGGWALDFVSDVSFSDGWRGAIDQLDQKISLAVATDLLSFQEAQHGSRAQASVHRTTALDTARLDARWLESVINDQLIKVAIAVNHGEVDPEDMPKWRSKIHSNLDLAGVNALYNMGVPIDAGRLAEEFGVPVAVNPDADTIVAQKVEQPDFPFAPGGGKTGNRPPKKDEKRGSKAPGDKPRKPPRQSRQQG